MILPLLTISATAAIVLAFSVVYLVKVARKSPYLSDYNERSLLATVTILNTAWLSVITVPAVMFLLGGWSWPLADWSLSVQVLVVIPSLVFIFFGVTSLVLGWEKDLNECVSRETFMRHRVLAVSRFIYKSALLWLIGFAPIVTLLLLAIGGTMNWGVVVSVVVVWLPVALLIVANVIIRLRSRSGISRHEDTFEAVLFSTVFLWIPGLIWLLLVLTVSLWFLAAPPLLLLLSLLISGGGGGGGGGGYGGGSFFDLPFSITRS